MLPRRMQIKNEKSSFEASGFPLFFFEGGGSNVCKPGDEINEREQWDKKSNGVRNGK